MATRAKNATQHPGHVQRKPRQPVGPDAKSKKADAAAAKAAKAAARRLGAERLVKFEQDAMEKEDILDATPRPVFTPTAGRTLVPTSGPSAATSVLESEVDTDEMNPDKRTYNPGSTTDDNSESDLSAIPTSPAKRTYAEVASPKRKPVATTGTKAALGTQPVNSAPAMPKGVQSGNTSGSTTEPDSLPPPSPPPRVAKSIKDGSRADTTTTRERKVGKVVQPDSAQGRSSSPTPTAPSRPLNLTTSTPANKKHRKLPSPQATGSETEPDSPPRAPKPCSLQRLGSYVDLGELDPSLREMAVTSKKKLSGSRAVASMAQNNNVGGASASDPALSWRTWKAREGNAEGMIIDLVKTGAAVQGKTRVNAKEGQSQKKGSITTIDSDIEISEIVKVGKKKHTIDQHAGEAKTKETEKGKGKGKGEGERRGKEKESEDVEMGRSKFITPALPPRAPAKRSHRNVDGSGPSNLR